MVPTSGVVVKKSKGGRSKCETETLIIEQLE